MTRTAATAAAGVLAGCLALLLLAAGAIPRDLAGALLVLDALVLLAVAYRLDRRLEQRHFEQKGRPEAGEYGPLRGHEGPFSVNRATRLGARVCVLVGLLYGFLGGALFAL
jgi:hypothetical protein